MFNRKQKAMPVGRQGFTLIELLVVIAIIGLLAGIVLVSLGGARNSARDARIIAEMSALRTQAEIYNSNLNTYVGFGASAPIATAVADINAQNGAGADLAFVESVSAYCAEVQMNTGWYCIDNTFVADDFAANPSCTGGVTPDYTCN